MNQYIIQAALQELMAERDKLQNAIDRISKLIGKKESEIEECQVIVKPDVLAMLDSAEKVNP